MNSNEFGVGKYISACISQNKFILQSYLISISIILI